MRLLMLSAAFAVGVCAAAPAMAQPAVLVKSKPITGTVPDYTADMPSKVRRWIDEETERQFKSPTTLYDLEYDMLKTLEPELQRMAKRQHLSYEETRVLVLHQVVTQTATRMDKAVHTRRTEVAKARLNPARDAQLVSLSGRKIGMLNLIQELGPRMTPNTRLLTSAKK
jgi:hypothetical protein